MTHYWRVSKDGGTLFRPVAAQNEGDARRRVLASLGMELTPISAEEFRVAEGVSLTSGGLPAISEACEPGEEMSPEAPCAGRGVTACPLRERCARWLLDARGSAVRR